MSTALRTDFCYHCNSFGTVTRERYNNQFLCTNCLVTYRNKIQDKIKNKKEVSLGKDDVENKVRILPNEAIRGNATGIIKRFFIDNPNKRYTSRELVEIFSDKFSYYLVMYALGSLCKRKIIYSRVICHFRNRRKDRYAIYSTDENQVKELQPEETAYKIRALMNRTCFLTSKDLMFHIQISQKNLIKIIKKYLSNEMTIYCYKNRYYYFNSNDSESINSFLTKNPGSKYVELQTNIKHTKQNV